MLQGWAEKEEAPSKQLSSAKWLVSSLSNTYELQTKQEERAAPPAESPDKNPQTIPPPISWGCQLVSHQGYFPCSLYEPNTPTLAYYFESI